MCVGRPNVLKLLHKIIMVEGERPKFRCVFVMLSVETNRDRDMIGDVGTTINFPQVVVNDSTIIMLVVVVLVTILCYGVWGGGNDTSLWSVSS